MQSMHYIPPTLSRTMSAHCLHTGTACTGRLCRYGLPQALQASRTKSFESAVTWLHADAAHYVPPCTPAAVWTRSMRRPLGGAASACPAHALFPLFESSPRMRSVGPISGRGIARDGFAQQRAAAGGAAVWWGAQGFSMPRYGSFPASAAWIGNGMGCCADGTPRDLVGSKIAEAHVHWGKHRERVMVQHVVGESRQHNVVAQGSAGGTRDAGVRSVSKQVCGARETGGEHCQVFSKEVARATG